MGGEFPMPHSEFTCSHGERGCERRGDVQLSQGPWATRVHIEIAPKDRPRHRSTSSELVSVPLKVKSRRPLPLLLREDATDVSVGEPRVVQIREPDMDLTMLQSESL